MKVKKEYLGSTIYKGNVKIHLTELMDERTMAMLVNEYPKVLEPIKKKKKDVTPKE